MTTPLSVPHVVVSMPLDVARAAVHALDVANSQPNSLTKEQRHGAIKAMDAIKGAIKANGLDVR